MANGSVGPRAKDVDSADGEAVTALPILYHYPMSPYSEKVRLAMGLNNQAWVSVVVPAQPPRRSLEDLVGGYRRIPVLQIGAQFYCDSELALMALFGTTSAAWGLDADDEALRRWAEEDIFFAVIAAAPPLKVLKYLFGQLGLVGIARFIRDRSRMMRDATVTVKASVVAAASVEKYVLHLAQLLAARPFLSGPRPGYLDLCCYHPLWMALAVDKGAAASWPLKVQEWITQMGQLTHGVSASASRGSVAEAITSDQVEISGEVSSPHHYGETVAVAPLDYARDETVGELLMLSDDRIVIRRRFETEHSIYLHFPRRGFEVRGH